MYTSPALLSVFIYFILMLLIIYKFHEYVVLDNTLVDKNSVYISNSVNSDTGEDFFICSCFFLFTKKKVQKSRIVVPVD